MVARAKKVPTKATKRPRAVAVAQPPTAPVETPDAPACPLALGSPGTAVKVLRSGRSWHGGEHTWSLPTQAPDGTWRPGDWTPSVAPVLCSAGWHLTTDPAAWWGEGPDVVGYLTEYAGAVDQHGDDEGKISVERARLLRPLTSAELVACRIYTEGQHEVTTGRAWASGSASVQAWDSARAHASGQATCVAWSGDTLVLTRADRGVIVDRRNGEPAAHVTGDGLGGWRYRDDQWTREVA